MYLFNNLDWFIDNLKQNKALEGCKIIKAYPFAMKPTKLNSTVIAVSNGEINADNISLGQEVLNGRCKINACVYTPYSKNDFTNIIEAVISSQLNSFPSSIAVSEISKNDILECLFVKCTFTFDACLVLRGDENES